jgi:phosphate transport system protein
MTRALFDKHLQELKDDILTLSSMVEKAIDLSVNALKGRDLKLANQIIAEDEKINRKRFEIEDKCMSLLATQQPMASDLRTIIATLYISNELERMADHAEGIARIAILIGEEPPLKPLVDIPRMAQKGIEMLRNSMEAFLEGDVKKAEAVCAADTDIDQLYDQVYRELISFMIEDPKTITRATRLLWVAHNLERIGDRATNIAERAAFAVTGKMVEMGTSRY